MERKYDFLFVDSQIQLASQTSAMHPVTMICIAFFVSVSQGKSFLVETEDTNDNIDNMKGSQDASMSSEDGEIWVIAFMSQYYLLKKIFKEL